MNSSKFCAFLFLSLAQLFITTQKTTAFESQQLELWQPCSLILNTEIQDVSCYGNNNANINVSVSGGTSPYSYLWNTGATTTNLNNLIAGIYIVTVADDSGCSAFQSVVVDEPDTMIGFINSTDASCETKDGTASVSVTGGNGGYTYKWSNLELTPSVTNLDSGWYSVSIQDSLGCEEIVTVYIYMPVPPTTYASGRDVKCYGGNDGTASASIVSGGTSPFSYSWSNGTKDNIVSGLSKGTYNVTINDGSDCASIVKSVDIDQPDSLSATAYGLAAVLLDQGRVYVIVFGGVTPYTYSWDDDSSQTTDTAINLQAFRTYRVIVTDANGCMDSSSAFVDMTGGFREIIPKINLMIYPNPTLDGTFSIEFKNFKKEGISLKVVDLIGRIVLDRQIDNMSSNIKYDLDLKENAKGIYFVEVLLGTRRDVQKLIYE